MSAECPKCGCNMHRLSGNQTHYCQAPSSLAAPHGSDHAVRQQLLYRISAELDRAYAKHGREQWGRHEFYAILKEEVDELWDAIKQDRPQPHVIEEAMQVAAMVFRYYETGDRYREPNSGIIRNP